MELKKLLPQDKSLNNKTRISLMTEYDSYILNRARWKKCSGWQINLSTRVPMGDASAKLHIRYHRARVRNK